MSTYRTNDTKTKLKMKKTHISSMKKSSISNANNLRDQQRLKQSSKRRRLERRVQTLSDAWRCRKQRCLSPDEADCSRHQVQTPRTNADRIDFNSSRCHQKDVNRITICSGISFTLMDGIFPLLWYCNIVYLVFVCPTRSTVASTNIVSLYAGWSTCISVLRYRNL